MVPSQTLFQNLKHNPLFSYLQKLSDQLSKATLELFEKGNIEAISKDRDVVEQADLLPYDKSIEFPFEKLQFGELSLSMVKSGSFHK